VIDSSGDVDAPEPQNLLYFMALSKNGADLKAWERVAMGYEGDDLQSVGYATAEQMIKYGPPINPPSEAPL
jgi:phage protein D